MSNCRRNGVNPAISAKGTSDKNCITTTRGKRCKLWWSGKNDEIRVEILMKEEFREKVIEFQKKVTE